MDLERHMTLGGRFGRHIEIDEMDFELRRHEFEHSIHRRLHRLRSLNWDFGRGTDRLTAALDREVQRILDKIRNFFADAGLEDDDDAVADGARSAADSSWQQLAELALVAFERGEELSMAEIYCEARRLNCIDRASERLEDDVGLPRIEEPRIPRRIRFGHHRRVGPSHEVVGPFLDLDYDYRSFLFIDDRFGLARWRSAYTNSSLHGNPDHRRTLDSLLDDSRDSVLAVGGEE